MLKSELEAEVEQLEAEVGRLCGEQADLRHFIIRHYPGELDREVEESTFEMAERLIQRLRYAEARVEVEARVRGEMRQERSDWQEKARVANWAVRKTKELATDALVTDGGHHKQWFLERILTQLGVDLVVLEKELRAKGFIVHEGMAP